MQQVSNLSVAPISKTASDMAISLCRLGEFALLYRHSECPSGLDPRGPDGLACCARRRRRGESAGSDTARRGARRAARKTHFVMRKAAWRYGDMLIPPQGFVLLRGIQSESPSGHPRPDGLRISPAPRTHRRRLRVPIRRLRREPCACRAQPSDALRFHSTHAVPSRPSRARTRHIARGNCEIRPSGAVSSSGPNAIGSTSTSRSP